MENPTAALLSLKAIANRSKWYKVILLPKTSFLIVFTRLVFTLRVFCWDGHVAQVGVARTQSLHICSSKIDGSI